MKLILTAEVDGLGIPGDVVDVAAGYGRNYLLPQGKAIVATKGAEKQIATIKRAQSAREIRGVEHAREVKSALEATTVTITAKTHGDSGKLFGSVTGADIAAAVKSAGGPVLDKRVIALDGAIKAVGSYPVTVKLHPEVIAKVTVTVRGQ